MTSKKTNIDMVKEEIKSLRVNFEHVIGRKNVAIGFSATDMNVSKSDVIVSLARDLAQNGRKVVIIDANYRDPKISEVSQNESVKGLSNILLKRAPYENEIIVDMFQKNLDLILTGEIIKEPVEVLDSSHLKHFIQAIKSHYDYVLIDTPANKDYCDANLIATYTDGFIIVTQKNKSTQRQLYNSTEAIKKVGSKLIGIVVTN
ncbi:MAG: CpsD/CapB family tyrosine-protein kinase [Tissierellia bacterium]|nr:CpsD/CapB family tyrosine-protein kinase [Tissierellia bacterium]